MLDFLFAFLRIRKAFSIICLPIVCVRVQPKGLKCRSDDRRKYFRRSRYLLNLFSRHNRNVKSPKFTINMRSLFVSFCFSTLGTRSWRKIILRYARNVFNRQMTWINNRESEKFLKNLFLSPSPTKIDAICEGGLSSAVAFAEFMSEDDLHLAHCI